MIFDGRRYAVNHSLGFRPSNETDVYAEDGFVHSKGERIPTCHVVVFPIKEARTYEKDGRNYYDPQSVPPEKTKPLVGHSLTNLALGPPKVRKAGNRGVRLNIGTSTGHVIVGEARYVEQAHYLVKDGRVYQWTSRRMARPEDLK